MNELGGPGTAAESAPDLAQVDAPIPGTREEQRGAPPDPALPGAPEATLDPADTVGWLVRVVDLSGAPVPDLQVLLTRRFGSHIRSPGTTDADGLVLIPQPALSPAQRAFSPPEAALPLHPDLVARPQELPRAARPPAPIELTVEPATAWQPARLYLDESRTPCPDTRLVLATDTHWGTARSDATGYLRLPAADAGSAVIWSISPSRSASGPDGLHLVRGENPEIEILIHGSGPAIDLLAVDADTGAPVPTARWRQNDRQKRTLAADTASFAWRAAESLEGSWGPDLIVEAEGYAAQEVRVRTQPEAQPVQVALSRIETLELELIFSAAGEPLAETSVELTAQVLNDDFLGSTRFSRQARVTTDENGRALFTFEWAAGEAFPAEIEFRTDRPGAKTWRLRTAALGPQPWMLDLAPPTGLLRVVFTDTDGQPLAGQTVELDLASGQGGPPIYDAQRWRSEWRQEPSGAEGVVVASLPAGVPFQWAHLVDEQRMAGSDDWETPLTAGEVRTITRAGLGSGRISGRCVLPEGFTELSWYGQLVLRRADGSEVHDGQGSPPSWAATGLDDTEGLGFNAEDLSFSFEGVPDGDYLITIPGVPLPEGPVPARAGDEGIEIALPAPCTLRLDVRDASTGEAVLASGMAMLMPETFGMISGGRGMLQFLPREAARVEIGIEGYATELLTITTGLEPGAVLERVVELQPGRELTLLCDNPAQWEEDALWWTALGSDDQPLMQYGLNTRELRTRGEVLLRDLPPTACRVAAFRRDQMAPTLAEYPQPIVIVEVPAGLTPLQLRYTFPTLED